MNETPANNNTEFHWPSLLQAVFTACGVLFSLAATGLLVIAAAGELAAPSEDPYLLSTLISLSYAGLAAGLLLSVPLYFSILRLTGGTPAFGEWWQKLRSWFHPKRLLVGYPAVILLGVLSNQMPLTRNLFLPLFNILALTIPVIVLLWLALRSLPKGSPQREWGSFSLGFTVAPAVAVVVELTAFVIALMFLGLSLENDPVLEMAVSRFSFLVYDIESPYYLEQAVGELLTIPKVTITLLVLFAGVAPLIEEFVKPISVWALLGRKLRPVDGWVIGVLSGAGFALLENFGQASVSADWLSGVLSRGAASIPHIFTAGLMGYTLVLARTQKKYGKAFLIFLAVFSIHSAWNGFTVLNVVAMVAPLDGWIRPEWAPVFLIAVVLLALGMLIALMRINRTLREENHGLEHDEMLPEVSLPQIYESDLKETQLDGTDNNGD